MEYLIKGAIAGLIAVGIISGIQFHNDMRAHCGAFPANYRANCELRMMAGYDGADAVEQTRDAMESAQ